MFVGVVGRITGQISLHFLYVWFKTWQNCLAQLTNYICLSCLKLLVCKLRLYPGYTRGLSERFFRWQQRVYGAQPPVGSTREKDVRAPKQPLTGLVSVCTM